MPSPSCSPHFTSQALALALYSGRFWPVSVALVAKAIGATAGGVRSRGCFYTASAVRSAPHQDAADTREAAGTYGLDVYSWEDIALGGLPGGSLEGGGPIERYASCGLLDRAPMLDAGVHQFASPPLAVLATSEARVATHKSQRCCFMLHSVKLAVTTHAANCVLQEVAELRKIEHPNLLSILAVVADQPCGQVGLLSELTEGSLATLLDKPPVRLTWSNGLLAIATDVAAGLAHLHGLGVYNAKLFLGNVMITSTWRAKLAEFSLDHYLTTSHDEIGAANGEHNLLASSHDGRGALLPAALFVSPESDTVSASLRYGDQHQRTDAWAFGCLLASLALHQKPANQHSTTRQKCGTGARKRPSWLALVTTVVDRNAHRLKGADMDGWNYDERVSKDRPGRCVERELSKRKLSIVRTAGVTNGNVRGSIAGQNARRPSCVQRKFEALACSNLSVFEALAERRKQAEADVLRSKAETLIERRKQKLSNPSRCSRGGPSTNSAPPPSGGNFHGPGSARRDSRCAEILKGVRRTSLRPKAMPDQLSSESEARGGERGLADLESELPWTPPLSPPPPPPLPPLPPRASCPAMPTAMPLQTVLLGEGGSARQAGLPRGTAGAGSGVGTSCASEGANELSAAREGTVSDRACPSALYTLLGEDLEAGPSSGYRSTHMLNAPSSARRAQFMQSRLPDGGGEAAEAAEREVIRQAEGLVAQAVETSRVQLMMRASQGRVSPLDGVTPLCCPRPLLQLATQCCALDPEARPALTAVLEQLQDEVLSAVDASESAARRPQPQLAGWRNATKLVLKRGICSL